MSVHQTVVLFVGFVVLDLAADIALNDHPFDLVPGAFQVGTRILRVQRHQPRPALVITDPLTEQSFAIHGNNHVGAAGAHLGGFDDNDTLGRKFRLHAVIQHLQGVKFVVTAILCHIGWPRNSARIPLY